MNAPTMNRRGFLVSLLAPLLRELRAVAAWLSEPALWTLLLVALALWALAYTVPFSARLDFGGDAATHRRLDDAPYLADFHPSEPAPPPAAPNKPAQEWWQLAQPPHRWTKPDSTITLPGVGAGRWQVRLRAAGQPLAHPTSVTLSDGATTATLALGREIRQYHLLASATNGDLTLRFSAPPLQLPGDPRVLGFDAYRATFAPTAGVVLPAPGQLGLLAATLALLYGVARRLALAPRATLGGGLGGAALLALLLARHRLALTVFTPTLLAIAAGCYVLAVILCTIYDLRFTIEQALPAHPLTRSPLHPFTPLPAYAVIALILLAFALRLGVLHPQRQAVAGDVGLNANNLRGVIAGQVYFTEALPGEAGGYQVPYPPGQYLVLAPLRLLIGGDQAWRRTIEIGNALWDALIVGLLWYTLRRAGSGERAALLGAALYIVAVPLLRSFVVGEYANIFGQGLALPLLVFLTFEGWRLRERRGALVALALLALAVLGHLGVTISLALLLLCLGAVWLASAALRRSVAPLALVGVGAALLVALLYHTSFLHLFAQTPAVRPPSDGKLAPGALAQAFGAFARALSQDTLPPLLVALGLAGALLLGRRAAARPLAQLLLAWWAATLLALVPPLTTLRWQAFCYPALCLGAGPALAALWRRGRAARFVVGGALALLLWRGAVLYINQLASYLH